MDAPLIPLYVVAFAALYFQILMLVSIVGAYEQHTRARHKRAAHHPTHTWPSVAIIVPCFNEERTVAKTIHSLLALHYPADKLEIIVVDDGSTDATYARAAAARNDSIEAARAANRHIPTITLRRQENGGKHTAMNWGITHTKASFVGCLDADSEVAPDALTHIIPFFADAHVAAVTPAIHIRNPQTIWQHMQKAEYGIGVIMKMAHGYLDAIHVTPGPFSIFRRSVFSTIGLFRRAHNVEDMEIAYRLQDHGFKIKKLP
jgi:cellulose synthase/poly-beta-1,6-N-acetylglucosamine synthase-like glycosyltransferase